MTQKKSRSLYWDIAKGWGIAAIVLGHTGYFAGAFVYLFHLALFFFITGYFYSEEKYGDAPFLYFGTRLAGTWPRYVFYTLFFVLLHNFFVTSGIYAGQGIYNHSQMLASWMGSIAFNCPEQMQNALWFVPVWLISSGLFAGAVWFGRSASARFSCPRLRLWIIGFVVLCLGLIGVFLNERKYSLLYNMQTSFLVVPIYFAAWMMRCFIHDFRRYATWPGCILSAILLHLVNSRLYIFIDLASMSIPGILYYPISFLGIYFALSLSAFTERLKPLARFMAFLGRHSFDIMAIHFALFKFIDYGYARLILKQIPENISDAPVSFRQELGPIYLIIGLLLPAFIGCGIDAVTRIWHNTPTQKA